MSGVCILLFTASATYFSDILADWGRTSDIWADCLVVRIGRRFPVFGSDYWASLGFLEGDRYVSNGPITVVSALC